MIEHLHAGEGAVVRPSRRKQFGRKVFSFFSLKQMTEAGAKELWREIPGDGEFPPVV
jgi:hypothetical protein